MSQSRGRLSCRHSTPSRIAWVLVAGLVALPSAGARAVTIGSTVFPLGELAFPDATACLDPGGCSGEVLVVDASFDPIAPAQALLGHELGLVAVDLGREDVLQIRFPAPLRDQPGPDLFLAQAQFVGDLASPDVCGGSGPAGVHDAEIRLDGGAAWQAIPCSAFSEDAAAGFSTVFYADPEIKSDAYRLWIATVDLAALGMAPDTAIAGFDLRGPEGGGLDAAITGSLNVPEAGPTLLLGLALGSLAAIHQSRWSRRRPAGARETAQLAGEVGS